MFGLLLKLVVLVAIVGGGGFFVKQKFGAIPSTDQLTSMVKEQVSNVNMGTLTQNLGSSLDSLVTHPDKNSPVVLGVKISNDSLATVIDVIQKLPPDQVNQVKSMLCAPIPTASPASSLNR